jgi:hypothetical protein
MAGRIAKSMTAMPRAQVVADEIMAPCSHTLRIPFSGKTMQIA